MFVVFGNPVLEALQKESERESERAANLKNRVVPQGSSKLRRSVWLRGLRRCLPCRWPGFDPQSRPDL
jgi:hypothetical protein